MDKCESLCGASHRSSGCRWPAAFLDPPEFRTTTGGGSTRDCDRALSIPFLPLGLSRWERDYRRQAAVTGMVLLQMAAVYVPLFQRALKTQALSLGELTVAVALSSVVF